MKENVFKLDNSYLRELPDMAVAWKGAPAPAPVMARFNHALARELVLDSPALAGPEGAAILCGAITPPEATPIAQAYSGHQFGGFSPRLGDGRALLLGEVIDSAGRRRDIHLKGSGRTPFSRGGDGKAVLGPVLREYLMGEAMHALGIPSTRALAAVITGENVQRESLLPGAVLARVAASHIRVGTFQYAAVHAGPEQVRALADYAIRRHYPALVDLSDRHAAFFMAVCESQAMLLAQWMQVGFVHGVMNTDNMAISGETIDYGPCAFIDAYDPGAVFSSIDEQGRYAFGNQPGIAQWNLARLAETLLPLLAPHQDEAITVARAGLAHFADVYRLRFLEGMRAKLGLPDARDEDADLIKQMLELLQAERADYTRFFRALALDDAALAEVLPNRTALAPWLGAWRARLGPVSQGVSQRMNRVNPVYIPRNHKVEEALAAAYVADFGPFDRLLDALSHPFNPRPDLAEFASGPPEEGPSHVTY